jgi:hypothetical protein
MGTSSTWLPPKATSAVAKRALGSVMPSISETGAGIASLVASGHGAMATVSEGWRLFVIRREDRP